MISDQRKLLFSLTIAEVTCSVNGPQLCLETGWLVLLLHEAHNVRLLSGTVVFKGSTLNKTRTTEKFAKKSQEGTSNIEGIFLDRYLILKAWGKPFTVILQYFSVLFQFTIPLKVYLQNMSMITYFDAPVLRPLCLSVLLIALKYYFSDSV